MHAALVWTVVFLVGCLAEETSTKNEPSLVCTPKGLLQLEKPFPAPGTHKNRLPFCSKFGCGCCGQRSVRIIARAVTEGWSDDSLPDTCRAVLEQMYCSVCDPQVGTDSQPVCESTCKLWWAACKDAFFSIDGTGNLVPCGPAASTHLICSQLKSIAPDHKQLCTMAGYTVGDSGSSSCFSGTPTTPPELCSSEFHDPDSHIFEASEAAAKTGIVAMIEAAGDIRVVLRGVMVIAFITFVVKRFALRNQQHQIAMQRLQLHQQRMRLQNQQRQAAAAAAIAREEAAKGGKEE